MPIKTDLDFARRSVTYLLEHEYSANQIVSVLTNELGLAPEAAQLVVSESADLVAA